MRRAFPAFALILLAAGCANPSFIPVEVKDINLDSERNLMHRAEEEIEVLDAGGQVYKDRLLEEYVNRVAAKLVNSGDRKRISVKVLRDPWLEAVAYPTGRIYVYTGMLAAMNNEAQLALILGHEITHVVERHAAREFTSRKKKSAEEAGSLRRVLTSASFYSRSMEAAADAGGIRLMAAAGYDPREAARMLEHLKRQVVEEKIKERHAYSSHPAVQERIQNATDLVRKNYPNADGAVSEDAYTRVTTRVLLDNAELDLKRGNYGSAERALEKYAARRPADPKAFYLLGEVYREGHKDGEEKARSYYRKAMTVSRDEADPYRGLGLLECRQGHALEARENLIRYLKLRPDADDREHISQYMNSCK